MTYTNGDCVVKIESLPEVDNSWPLRPYTVGTDNIIQIENPEGVIVPLHEYPLTTSDQRKDVLRVIIDIYEDAGMYLGEYLYMKRTIDKDTKKPKPNSAAAYESEGKIYINPEGGINPFLSHKFNLLNTLFHENIHRIDGTPISILDHALVYFAQIEDPTFSNCQSNYKEAILSSMSERFLSEIVYGGMLSQSNVEAEMTKFNNLENGYFLQLITPATGVETYFIKIFLNGNQIKEIEFNPEVKDPTD